MIVFKPTTHPYGKERDIKRLIAVLIALCLLAALAGCAPHASQSLPLGGKVSFAVSRKANDG